MDHITININEDTTFSVDLEGVTLEKFLLYTTNAQLNLMKQVISAASEELEEKELSILKNQIYDEYNIMVSGVLEQFAPEFELRPNLTAKAIKEAEDRIIMEGRLDDVEPGT